MACCAPKFSWQASSAIVRGGGLASSQGCTRSSVSEGCLSTCCSKNSFGGTLSKAPWQPLGPLDMLGSTQWNVAKWNGRKRIKRGDRTCCRPGESEPQAAVSGNSAASGHLSPVCNPSTLWEELRPSISYLPESHLERVAAALQLAFEAHDGQKRKSGEPYIIHPVAVAEILGQLEMDSDTIIAGLLHDTVEDTEMVTFELIEELFGPTVRRIVEGETKVSKLGKVHCPKPGVPPRDVKADDLRQMFLAMTGEVRVIIVKLADRLHNMRTLGHMPPHKQQHIAQETLQVFAPLARLLGMYRVKAELEDLSLCYSKPGEYQRIAEHVKQLSNEQHDVVLEARRVVEEHFFRDKFLDLTAHAQVFTLSKEPYSIFRKMVDTGCKLEDIRDIAQLRVVLKLKKGAAGGEVCNVQQVCYHVLGIIHAMWPPIPGTVKDYIATPKPNGYQSLHTTVLPLGAKTLFPLEIQIRTEEMHKLAEWGVAAAHSGRRWGRQGECRIVGSPPPSNGAAAAANGAAATSNGAASSGNGAVSNGAATSGNGAALSAAAVLGGEEVDIAKRVSWLNSIREWQEEFVGNMTAREFVDTITGDLLSSRVFVFTPKGEIMNLPKGATVVDYAYHIHTDVGNKMVGAKVNGSLVSPTHCLANAEVVEVMTYEGASTKRQFELHQQWMAHARTRSARHKLTKFLKEQGARFGKELTDQKVEEFFCDACPPLEDYQDLDSCLSSSDSDEEDAPRPAGAVEESSSSGQEGLDESTRSFFAELLARTRGAGAGEATEALRAESGAQATTSSPAQDSKRSLEDKKRGSTGGGELQDRWKEQGGERAGAARTRVGEEAAAAAAADFDRYQQQVLQSWRAAQGAAVLWLDVRCYDRKGLLADVSQILSDAGFSIRSYTGRTHRGLGMMLFQLDGTADLDGVVEKVDGVESVTQWVFGSTWKPPDEKGVQ